MHVWNTIPKEHGITVSVTPTTILKQLDSKSLQREEQDEYGSSQGILLIKRGKID